MLWSWVESWQSSCMGVARRGGQHRVCLGCTGSLCTDLPISRCRCRSLRQWGGCSAQLAYTQRQNCCDHRQPPRDCRACWRERGRTRGPACRRIVVLLCPHPLPPKHRCEWGSCLTLECVQQHLQRAPLPNFHRVCTSCHPGPPCHWCQVLLSLFGASGPGGCEGLFLGQPPVASLDIVELGDSCG